MNEAARVAGRVRRGAAPQRVLAVLLAATLWMLGMLPTVDGDRAWAHGALGLAFQGVSGPYLVSVFDGRNVDRTGRPEYRIVLTRDPGDGRAGAGAPVVPVPGARIVVTDELGVRYPAPGIGNVYGVQLPDRDQDLRIAIDAPAGSTALSVRVHGVRRTAAEPARHGPSTSALLLGAAAAAAVLTAVAWYGRRGRSSRLDRGEVLPGPEQLQA